MPTLVPIDPMVLAGVGLVMLAIASLWLPFTYLWCVVFGLAVATAAWSGVLGLPAFLPISVLILGSYLLNKIEPRSYSRIGTVLTISVLIGVSFGLGSHVFPGFQKILLVKDALIGVRGDFYTQYLNFDKALVGLIILGFSPGLLRNACEWKAMVRAAWPIFLITIVGVIGVALTINYVRFDPKMTGFFLPWALINLLFTCVSEEAFFRGLLQHRLTQALKNNRHGALLSVIICALLFGVAHYAGGVSYVILACLAGLGYGWVYHKTQRIEAAILTHFGLNTTHFLFFSYPSLA